METRTLHQMEDEFVEFAKKHHYEFSCYVSAMTNNEYHKRYIFKDGAVWYEYNDIVTEEIHDFCYGIEVNALVKLTRCEYWNTDDSKSKYVFAQIH